ncbi:trehalose-6-phosphate synthase [Frigidibacter sp.]|uniref:alpha,alpha-trehalose-phosphate synthase (UDP-forming) n=1 Tax=Frigidibacter sp. TaxID=2586418 RepID=UPI002733EBC8|nr:trehalose-6-phosphate synthase [Frigidibacter sp.]MDP3339370.1 trehalose-6-phosphate synthase [Frigidibacter sp.]
MGRLICISNRIPLGPNPSGGLVVALADVLERTGGIWIGSAAETVENPADTFTEIEGGKFRRLSFDLSPEDKDNYYAGYANSVLWPLFHDRTDLMEIRSEYYDAYRSVNRRLAKMLIGILRPDDRLWVHDFHLMPLAHELRLLGAKNAIGFFLHTPFPTHLAMQAMPYGAEMCKWLMRYDLVGLQVERDVVHARVGLTLLGGAEEGEGDTLRLGKETTRVVAFPIGIDAADFAKLAAEQFEMLPQGIVKPTRQMMIGVDRLDYSKGLPQRFRAFGTFLERHEDWHRHVSLLQISPPTREGVKAYDDIRDELEHLAGRINGRFADITWAPIRYIHRPIPRETLAGLYRAAHVALVTPLMDGMNLVAKEFIAAQNPNDPGVLILSRFAGAAEQMTDALMVNPHDDEQIAATMLTALTMPRSERSRRYEALMEGLLRQDVHWWSESFLAALDEAALASA